MANKKEPPFYNDNNMGPCHYKFAFYETMELFIETLTGTCFELLVSPFETVISVKSKIQRLEGIPVSQQHLIWNNVELEDDYCLNDYNISEGCTLKLILAMRGGPINTRRVPVGDPIREITEYMDPSRDDIWEKVPSSKQVTFLVYREGDQLNFFRIIDKGDGTLTPLSESLSGGSVYNLYADDEEDTEASPSGEQIIENSITMNKMKLLRAKMENMNLSKKPKKTIKVNPHPPLAPRPSSGSVTAAHQRFLRALRRMGQPCLPPRNSNTSDFSQNALSFLTSAGRRMPSTSNDFVKENDRWETAPQSLSSIRLPPKIPHVEKEDAKLPANSVVLPVPAPLRHPGRNIDNSSATNEAGPFLYPNLTNVKLYATEEKVIPNSDTFALLAEPCSDLYGIGKVNTELHLSEGDEDSASADLPNKTIRKLLTPAAADTTGILNSCELSPQKNTQLSPLHCSTQMTRYSPRKPQAQSKFFEVGNLRPAASPNVLRSLELHNLADSSYPRTSKFHGIGLDSPSKRPDLLSKMEAREVTEVAVKASKDPVVSVNNVGFLSSLARSANRDALQNSCGTSRFRTSGIARTTNLQHFQGESYNMAAPHNEMPGYFLSPGLGLNGSIVAAGKRIAGDATHLPPVNGSVQPKKKMAKHCFFCGKKTGLATSYEYVETTSVQLTAMQRLTRVLMTTRMQGGGTYRRPILWSVHQSFPKSEHGCMACICLPEEPYYTERSSGGLDCFFCHAPNLKIAN
ncbi:AN1-type zinc finger protein 4 isoform X1 [Lacerta agilis]|uniref:AN1-type zinc finger protein 4 isoform X1 n=1 Tax=Lacerta agilis TaxID=80427 RepID=UPI001419B943|nr:AN1-type zinc finger protein 4 isoform X1 [Lacerta agilis]